MVDRLSSALLNKTNVSIFSWVSRITAALTDSDATEEQKEEAAARFVKMKTIQRGFFSCASPEFAKCWLVSN